MLKYYKISVLIVSVTVSLQCFPQLAGSVDTAYFPFTGLQINYIQAMGSDGQGRVIIAGKAAAQVDGVQIDQLIRLSPNGNVDASFQCNLDDGILNSVINIKHQLNRFPIIHSNHKLYRLNEDGSFDKLIYEAPDRLIDFTTDDQGNFYIIQVENHVARIIKLDEHGHSTDRFSEIEYSPNPLDWPTEIQYVAGEISFLYEAQVLIYDTLGTAVDEISFKPEGFIHHYKRGVDKKYVFAAGVMGDQQQLLWHYNHNSESFTDIPGIITHPSSICFEIHSDTTGDFYIPIHQAIRRPSIYKISKEGTVVDSFPNFSIVPNSARFQFIVGSNQIYFESEVAPIHAFSLDLNENPEFKSRIKNTSKNHLSIGVLNDQLFTSSYSGYSLQDLYNQDDTDFTFPERLAPPNYPTFYGVAEPINEGLLINEAGNLLHFETRGTETFLFEISNTGDILDSIAAGTVLKRNCTLGPNNHLYGCTMSNIIDFSNSMDTLYTGSNYCIGGIKWHNEALYFLSNEDGNSIVRFDLSTKELDPNFNSIAVPPGFEQFHVLNNGTIALLVEHSYYDREILFYDASGNPSTTRSTYYASGPLTLFGSDIKNQIYIQNNQRFLRLDTNGFEDWDFLEASVVGTIHGVTFATDNAPIVYGDFLSYNGVLANGIVKLVDDGLVDIHGVKNNHLDISIFPNPISKGSSLSIKHSLSDPFTISFYTLQGKLVDKKQNESKTHTITAPTTPGVYLLRMEHDSKFTFKKIVVTD